jgi:hypothetical protein
LHCASNQLTSLNIKNGANDLIDYFDAQENPLLKCIQVDDPNKIGINWFKDDTAVYNTKCSGVSTKDTWANSDMKLYPNPASNTLYLGWEGETESVKVELFNSLGVLVKTRNVTNQGSINVEDLSHGLYLCRISDAESVIQASTVIIE